MTSNIPPTWASLPLLGLTLSLAACGQKQPDAAAIEAAVEVAPGCEIRSFEGSDFTVCSFDSGKEELQLRWAGSDGVPLSSFARLEDEIGRDVPRVKFAVNAGMYDEARAPIGLYVEKGVRLKKLNLNKGPGNFHLSPNGVFAMDRRGRMTIVRSADFTKTVSSPVWATQSGPMLVIDGKLHPKFDKNGESRFSRNAVGLRDARHAYFVISEEPVSFGHFARFFRDVLGCRNALYLDGSVSSLWDPAAGRQDPYSQLGPMILVLRRSDAK